MKKSKESLPEEELKAAVGQEETPKPASEALAEEAAEPDGEPSAEKPTDGSPSDGSGEEEQKERVKEDIALFHELFPSVPAGEIPEEVWQKVERGESLAASYALYFIQSVKRAEHIRGVNDRNEKTAPPKIRHDGTENDYFSPEAVKNMSQSEVKKHYNQILHSMDKWN